MPRPEDHLEDQGLAFDLATVFSRRRALAILRWHGGRWRLLHDLAADVLEQSGVVRSDLTSSFGDSAGGTATGVPMELELTILDIAGGGGPMTSAAVYVWHCTDSGLYSMYSTGVEDENFLRGVQVTDDAGRVRFTSIVPGCYAGRWPDIHFEVYPDEASITDHTLAISTSQVALPQGVCRSVYATDGYAGSTEEPGPAHPRPRQRLR